MSERPLGPVPQTIAGLVHRLEAGLASVIAPGSCWALLDYPFHANVGHAAIWVGERRLLGALGARIRYMTDISAYSARLLARA
jgi:exopolysaccharide biosynthesis predicted pyruvyltransferase EpsI